MTPIINLGTNTATTKDWLEVTKDQSIFELVPRNLGTETSTPQMTEMGEEIPAPPTGRFFGDLKRVSRRSSHR